MSDEQQKTMDAISSELDPRLIVNHCRDLLGIPQLSWNPFKTTLDTKTPTLSRTEGDRWAESLFSNPTDSDTPSDTSTETFTTSTSTSLTKTNQTEVPDHLYHELEIFKNVADYMEGGIPPVFDSIDKTYLSFGRYHLRELLRNPSTDISTLHTIQAQVRNLTKNYNVEELKSDFETLRGYEPGVYWFWKERDIETNRYLHQLYFDHPLLARCNKSESILSLCSFYKIIYSPAMVVVSPIICLISPFIISRFILKVPITFREYRTQVLGNMIGRTGVIRFVGKKKKYIRWIQYLSIFFWMFSYFQGMYNSIYIAKNTYCIHGS